MGSGSKGNATVVSSGNTRLLIDCGFSLRETQRRLQRVGLSADQLSGILVTHEHGDHIQGVARLSNKFKIPVYLSFGTAQSKKAHDIVNKVLISPHQAFSVGDIEINPVAVPHDAREACQFVLGDGATTLGILTDLGKITPLVAREFNQCQGLVLECNHDLNMLHQGPYPYSLKKRVGGDLGHLNNQQAADFLATAQTQSLQQLVLAHISEQNNTTALATNVVAKALSCAADELFCADQDLGFDWLQLS